MANSRFEYVKQFESENFLLPQAYIVIRIDGRCFHRLSKCYQFSKPNDINALQLMNCAAKEIFTQFPDINIAYGDSDEYSFVFNKNCQLFERREAKLVSTLVSTFTSLYIYNWDKFFPNIKLRPDALPTFDGRAILYPNYHTIRDYLSWRQVDCHINNLYNTTFWSLVLKGGMTEKAAEEHLKGTLSKDKNEILFSQFNINYNNEPEIYKKGTVIIRDKSSLDNSQDIDNTNLSKRQIERRNHKISKRPVLILHTDIIRDDFWGKYDYLLD